MNTLPNDGSNIAIVAINYLQPMQLGGGGLKNDTPIVLGDLSSSSLQFNITPYDVDPNVAGYYFIELCDKDSEGNTYVLSMKNSDGPGGSNLIIRKKPTSSFNRDAWSVTYDDSSGMWHILNHNDNLYIVTQDRTGDGSSDAVTIAAAQTNNTGGWVIGEIFDGLPVI